MRNLISVLRRLAAGLLVFVACSFTPVGFAQETTGAIQGVVTDPTGAVVAGATVKASSDILATPAVVKTDERGFYRLSALPPGTYSMSIEGSGMSARANNIKLLAGDLPNLNIKLATGVSTVIDVTDTVAMVDFTQSKVETTISQAEIQALPKGRSFQSVITYAPGVRQEPLQSLAPINGTSIPNPAGNANVGGNSTRANGFQIDGASDSENVYLSDGINITQVQGGGIGVNVPFEFVQDVQVKSSGFEAQYGGAMGGVVNVIQQRGGSSWHGSLFSYYRSDALNANDQCAVSITCFLRSDPSTSPNSTTRVDATPQYYIAKQDHYRYVDPGFTIGGPLLKKVFFFASYAPNFQSTRRDVNSTFAGNAGLHTYYQTANTQFGFARLDYHPTEKLRLFANWQYSFLRLTGQLPNPDSKIGQTNLSAGTNPNNFRPDGGFVTPLSSYSFGADYTLTSKTVFSVRYGYMFNNTHTLGTASGLRYAYQTSATGSTPTFTGTAIPASFQQTAGFSNIAGNQPTFYNVYTRKQLSTDLSHLQTGLAGTHNFRGGFSYINTGNNVKNLYDYASVLLYYGTGSTYSVGTTPSACDAIIAGNKAAYATAPNSCTGSYGYFIIRDGTDVIGSMNSSNYGLYIQDDWTVGNSGLTINAGVRFDKEYLPPYVPSAPSINFSFGSKIGPRIGAAYDVLHNGRLKAYGSYGQFYDIMKFSLPQTSFGGNYWHDCVYTLDTPDYTRIQPTAPVGPDGYRHSCPTTGLAPGVASNASTDTTGAGGAPGRFIENINYRAINNSADDPGVDPNIGPMKQWELVGGTEWAITPSLKFTTRYVHKQLENTIEDMGLTDSYGYYIGNPGSAYGDVLHRALPSIYRNATINNGMSPASAAGFLNPTGVCPQCPAQPSAMRHYNGLEFRIDKRGANYFFSAFYTYSQLRGNYSGLTNTLITVANGGTHYPDNTRSFDLPNLQFTAAGKPFGGPLPTDRPHTISVFGAYTLKWFGGDTNFGFSQLASSGTPLSTCMPLAGTSTTGCQFVEDQGNFVNLARSSAGDLISAGVTRNYRSPFLTQTDANLTHYVHVSKEHENRKFGAEFNVTNLLNQHTVETVGELPITTSATPSFATGSAQALANPTKIDYNLLMSGFNYLDMANGRITGNSTQSSKKIYNNQYNLPNMFQAARQIRIKVAYVF